MSNSNLVTHTNLSPNCNRPRSKHLGKITIHHMAGDLSVERCGEIFESEKRQASANYGIDSQGYVGLYVEEDNRAWTSGSPENDNQAVTIEVANDGGEETGWHVSDTAYAKLIELCVDICQRNGIAYLNFTGDATGNLTMHRYFQATTCPGPYLASRFVELAAEVNSRLGYVTPQDVAEEPVDVQPEVQPEPTAQEDPDVTVQVNIGGADQWLGTMYGKDSDITNEDTGYAGKGGRTIEAVCIGVVNAGFSVVYGVHTLIVGSLPAVSSDNANITNEETGYAGVIGHEIDGICMQLQGTDEYDIEYQVVLASGDVLPPVYGRNANWSDNNYGYAGKLGNYIQGITAKIIKK